MDLARPRKPEPEAVDVAALARDVVELASRSERSGAGDVAVVYEGPATSVWAICDSAQMRQVLWNLVRNGVQASGAGSTVRVSIKEQGAGASGRVLMAVADCGPGIAPSSQTKIFEAFFTTRSGGAGMGLAVVRRIIDDHAGVGATIEVRSNAADAAEGSSGQASGATFEVGLARAPSPITRGATVGHDLASDPGVTPGENIRSQPERT
jgi:signal transduction histidine kinase